MKTRNKILIVISVFVLTIILYVILDYFNLMKFISINIERINIDLLSIFITNLIVIGLYLITYLIVDSKNQIERKNKKEIIKYMLIDDYETCLRYLNVLEDKNQLKLIVEKLNTDDYLYKNDYFNNWMQVSFKNYNEIMQYSNQGLIDVEILKRYLYIRSNYSNTMSGYVLSLGMPKKIEELIYEGHQNLKREVEKEIQNINNYQWED